MIDPKLIERINYLVNKSKREGLSEEEKKEQIELRKEYLRLFKAGFKQQLDSIKIVKEYKENEDDK